MKRNSMNFVTVDNRNVTIFLDNIKAIEAAPIENQTAIYLDRVIFLVQGEYQEVIHNVRLALT